MTIITVEEVLKSGEVNGKDNVFTWNSMKIKDNKAKDKNAKNDCAWGSHIVRMEDKSLREKPYVEFKFVMCSSAVKEPKSSGDAIKFVNLCFKKLKIEDVLVGDFLPKKKSTKKEQDEENLRAMNRAKLIVQSTNDFVDFLEIYDLSGKKIEMELKKSKDLGFTLNKDSAKVKQIKDAGKKQGKKAHEIEAEINNAVARTSIKQTSAENHETGEEVEFDPIYRLRIQVDKDGKLGYSSWDDNKNRYVLKPMIYDFRKRKTENSFHLATVSSNGKKNPLTIKNCRKFITYKSVISGMLDITQFIISKTGISHSCNFSYLVIKRQQSLGSKESMKNADLSALEDPEDKEEEVVDNDADASNEVTSDLEDHKDVDNEDENDDEDIQHTEVGSDDDEKE